MSAHWVLLENPWQVRAADFPEAGDPDEKLAFVVNYAVLAPSILNTQPWKFRIAGGAVTLHADRTRILPVVDPDGRELLLSCGAALFNLCTAIRSFGCRPQLTMFPDPRDSDLLACVELSAATPSARDRKLREAIPERRTVRQPFQERPLPKKLLADLSQAAEQEGATLSFIEDAEPKRRIAELVADAERIHLADPAFRTELSRWIQKRVNEAHDQGGEALFRLGAAGHTPQPDSETALFTQTAASVARGFATAEEAAAHERVRVEASPLLVLLATARDRPQDWLAAGQALQHVLLTATLAGAAASYLNPPIELPGLRPRVAAAFGARDMPQVLLRLGYGPDIPPAPRRPVRDVLIVSPR